MKPSMEDGSWIRDELLLADFSDIRLNKRFLILAQELAAQPSLPINHASTDWASTKAAYRFFENPKVESEEILKPHYLSTRSRLSKYNRVIVIQDTTTLDFSTHRKTSGLGPITHLEDAMQGLLMHTTLALTEKGLPLGLLHNSIKSRIPQKATGHAHRKIPIDEKESFKWFEGLYSAKDLPSHEVIMVCDREADIYELFQEAQEIGVELVVRLQHDRVVSDDELEDIKVTDRLGIEPYQRKKICIDIPGSGRRIPRKAELSLRFIPITLAAHPRGVETPRTKNRQDLELYVVELHELNPPSGEDALVWYLLTTLSVSTCKVALDVMNIYKQRWQIEQYFKCLKTGCKIELCRLNSSDKLMKYINIQAVIAWRILWMTHLKRTDPTLSCEFVLTPCEWKALWLLKHKRQIKSGELANEPPNKPPIIGEAIKWIAMQGGFLGRKNDGDPGLITLWRGWLRLEAAAEVYALLKK